MPTLKINKNTNNELNRLVKNFNQKVARLEKLDKYNVRILPNKISKKELLNIENKRELNRKIQELKRFTKRGSEKLIETKGGDIFAKWELDNYKIARQRVLRFYNKKIKELETNEPKASGKKLGVTFAQMGDPAYITAIRNKQKILKIKTPDRKTYTQSLNYLLRQNEHTNLVLKENYMQGLLTLGYQACVPKEIMDSIHDKLLELNDKDFLNIFNNDLTVSKTMNWYRTYSANISKGYNLTDESWGDIYEDFMELYNNLDEILSR